MIQEEKRTISMSFMLEKNKTYGILARGVTRDFVTNERSDAYGR